MNKTAELLNELVPLIGKKATQKVEVAIINCVLPLEQKVAALTDNVKYIESEMEAILNTMYESEDTHAYENAFEAVEVLRSAVGEYIKKIEQTQNPA